MQELKTIQTALKQLNASKNATTFFLTSYKTGRASIGEIAKTAKMDRSSAYSAYEQLKALNLMNEDLKSKHKQVWTKEPKAVIARLRTEIRRMRRQVEEIEESMPSLLAEYASSNDRPILQVFTGKEGLLQIQEDILSNSNFQLLLLSNLTEESKVFTKNQHNNFIARRKKQNITLRLITTDSEKAKAFQKTDKQNNRETKIITGNPPFKNETYIYKDKIAMISFNEKTGIIGFIIQSNDFTEAQKWMFRQIWNTITNSQKT